MLKPSQNVFYVYLFFALMFAKVFPSDSANKPTANFSFQKEKNSKFNSTILFTFKDFPKDQQLVCLIERPLVKKDFEVSFRINQQDKIIFNDSLGKEELSLTARGFFLGEKITAIFKTSKGEVLCTSSFIPRPLKHEIPEKNLGLSAELAVADISIAYYKLDLWGLQEGEEYVLESRSGQEVIRKENSYRKGSIITITPDVLGEFGGHGIVTITTKNGTLSLQLPWGIMLFSYTIADSTQRNN